MEQREGYSLRRKRRIFGAAATMVLLTARSLLKEAGVCSLDTTIVGLDDTKIQNSQLEAEDWQLILVNRWNSIPDSWEVTLTQLQIRFYPALSGG